MALLCLIFFFNSFIYKYFFGFIANNITKFMRARTYSAILKKSISWFDNRDQSPGLLSTTLSTEVPLLNGVSQEGVGV